MTAEWWIRLHVSGLYTEIRKGEAGGSRPAGDGWRPLSALTEVQAQLEAITTVGIPVKTTKREGRPRQS